MIHSAAREAGLAIGIMLKKKLLLFVAVTLSVLVCSTAAWKLRYHVVMRNVQAVEPGHIYRGGLQQPGPLRRLIRQYGVRTIVSLRGPCDWEQEIARELDVEWHSVYMEARAPLAELSDEMAAAAALVADASKQPVFFHCDRGIDRSGLVQAAYRMIHCGWSPQRAIAELESMGPTTTTRKRRHLQAFYRDYVVSKQPAGQVVRPPSQ